MAISGDQVYSEKAFAGIVPLTYCARGALFLWIKCTDLVLAGDLRQKDWNSTEIPYLTACLNLYDFLLEYDFLVKWSPEEGCGDEEGML